MCQPVQLILYHYPKFCAYLWETVKNPVQFPMEMLDHRTRKLVGFHWVELPLQQYLFVADNNNSYKKYNIKSMILVSHLHSFCII